MAVPNRVLTAAALALALAWVGAVAPDARAQDPGDDIERLLDKVAGPEATAPDADAPDEPAGDLAPKDKDLDELLGDIGGTSDAPETKPDPRGPGGAAASPPEGDAEGGLDEEDRPLDDHIAEIAGLIKKKPEQPQADPSNSPLGQAIKKMDEVERRLTKPDTGEETRQKQQQIVKELEQLIAQARRSSSKGNQPGQEGGQGEQANNGPEGGSQPGGAPRPPMGTTRPNARSALAAAGKDAWGHLPPELRAAIDNALKEEALPTRKDLIDLYYLSVLKKGRASQGE